MLLKTSAYVKGYDGRTKWMYFFNEDDDLSEKHNTHNTIWNKVSADIKKKESISEPVYNKEVLETKMKSHGNELQIFAIKNLIS